MIGEGIFTDVELAVWLVRNYLGVTKGRMLAFEDLVCLCAITM